MLSRIAEALYWTGRYTERAEDTARLLDVAQRAALEGALLGSRETLAAVLGGAPVQGTRQEVLTHYCLDRRSPESIGTCVRAARENARTIRDAITSEMWEALNSWHLQVSASQAQGLTGGGAHTFLSAMRSKSYLFMGTADATMLREEGWQWLMLGRWIERVLFTCRVIAAHAPDMDRAVNVGREAQESYGWSVLLRAMSAYEAFRGSYRTGVSPDRVVEFLLLDSNFPRSVRHSAMRVDECLAALSDGAMATRAETRWNHMADVASPSSAARLAGRLRSLAENRLVEEVFEEGVALFTARLAIVAAEVHGALSAGPFARGPVLEELG
jgi:uncharacterized alpha-E superfamily protein